MERSERSERAERSGAERSEGHERSTRKTPKKALKGLGQILGNIQQQRESRAEALDDFCFAPAALYRCDPPPGCYRIFVILSYCEKIDFPYNNFPKKGHFFPKMH